MDRLGLARDARDGRARPADEGGLHRRRHLEPDDLPEGALDRRLVRRAARRAAEDRGRPDRDLPPAGDGGHPPRLRPDEAGLGADRRRRRLRLDRGRPDAGLRPRGDVRAGDPAARGGRQAERVREDPGDRPRPRRDRGLHREGQVDQRDADLLARALRGRRRGVHPRARAARRRRRRPDERRVGRELLRLARRHRGGPAARRDRRPGDTAAGEAGDREREARVPPLAGGIRRPALGVPRRQGREVPALPLGLDVDQEPRVPRRDVRRGADRARDREHDAGGDGRRLPGSRQGRGHAHRRRRRGAQAARALAEVGVDYDDVVATLEAEGVQKFADSFQELLDGIRAKRAELAAA